MVRRDSNPVPGVSSNELHLSQKGGRVEGCYKDLKEIQKNAITYKCQLTAIGSSWDQLASEEHHAKTWWGENTETLVNSNEETTKAYCEQEQQLYSVEVQICGLRECLLGEGKTTFEESEHPSWMKRAEAEQSAVVEEMKRNFQNSEVRAAEGHTQLQNQLALSDACLCNRVPSVELELAQERYAKTEKSTSVAEEKCMMAEAYLSQLQLELQQQAEQADAAQSSLVELIGACSKTEGQYRELCAKSEREQMDRTMLRSLEVEKEELRAEMELSEGNFTMLEEQCAERFTSQRSGFAPLPVGNDTVVIGNYPVRKEIPTPNLNAPSREMNGCAVRTPQRSQSGTCRLHRESPAPLLSAGNNIIQTSCANFLSNSPDKIRQLLNLAPTLPNLRHL